MTFMDIKIPNVVIPEGIKHCYINASNLAEDSELLFKAKRFSSALSLLTLAEEEVGKGLLLYDIVKQERDMTDKEYRKIFMGQEAHLNKLKRARDFYQEFYYRNSHNTDTTNDASEMAAKLEDKDKQLGFYVDWIDFMDWSTYQKEFQWYNPVLHRDRQIHANLQFRVKRLKLTIKAFKEFLKSQSLL